MLYPVYVSILIVVKRNMLFRCVHVFTGLLMSIRGGCALVFKCIVGMASLYSLAFVLMSQIEFPGC